MVTTTERDAIQEQTIKLCQTILDHPEFSDHTQKIEKFLADEGAKGMYVEVSKRGQELQQRQHQGGQVGEGEAEEFGRMRDEMIANPVVSDFMESQDVLNGIHQTISTYVAKTLELGRIPTEDDLQSDGCCGGSGGGSCGC